MTTSQLRIFSDDMPVAFVDIETTGGQSSWHRTAETWLVGKADGALQSVKKLKHETELFKAALLAAITYAEGRGAVEFEPTDSASAKLLYVYRLLVHDKMIQPLPEDQVAEKSMRHKLAMWYSKQLPKDHPLLS